MPGDGDGRFHGYPTGNRKRPSSKRDAVKADKPKPLRERRLDLDRLTPSFIDPARPQGF